MQYNREKHEVRALCVSRTHHISESVIHGNKALGPHSTELIKIINSNTVGEGWVSGVIVNFPSLSNNFLYHVSTDYVPPLQSTSRASK